MSRFSIPAHWQPPVLPPPRPTGGIAWQRPRFQLRERLQVTGLSRLLVVGALLSVTFILDGSLQLPLSFTTALLVIVRELSMTVRSGAEVLSLLITPG